MPAALGEGSPRDGRQMSLNLNLTLFIVPYAITLGLSVAALCVPVRVCSFVWSLTKTFGVISMFLVLAVIVSFIWRFAYEHEKFHLGWHSGGVSLVLPGLPGRADPRGVYIRGSHYGTTHNFVGQLARAPFFQVRHTSRFSVYSLPIIWPLLTIGIPCLILAFRRSIYHEEGHCMRCRYDLTGNTSGICPECGEPILMRK